MNATTQADSPLTSGKGQSARNSCCIDIKAFSSAVEASVDEVDFSPPVPHTAEGLYCRDSNNDRTLACEVLMPAPAKHSKQAWPELCIGLIYETPELALHAALARNPNMGAAPKTAAGYPTISPDKHATHLTGKKTVLHDNYPFQIYSCRACPTDIILP